MPTYDVAKIFNSYKENEQLEAADIFHIYDTGKECIVDNSGYHDSRHFRLVVFNTQTVEKCDLGIHDGIQNLSNNVALDKIRVYADGSFIVVLKQPVKLSIHQSIMLY